MTSTSTSSTEPGYYVVKSGEQLRDTIFEALDNALANGVDQRRPTPALEVAQDLVTCCSDLEHLDPNDITHLVTEWQLTKLL